MYGTHGRAGGGGSYLSDACHTHKHLPAVLRGCGMQLEVMRLLHLAGATLQLHDAEKMTALCIAAEQGQVSGV